MKICCFFYANIVFRCEIFFFRCENFFFRQNLKKEILNGKKKFNAKTKSTLKKSVIPGGGGAGGQRTRGQTSGGKFHGPERCRKRVQAPPVGFLSFLYFLSLSALRRSFTHAVHAVHAVQLTAVFGGPGMRHICLI